jgi:hypothetical protein
MTAFMSFYHYLVAVMLLAAPSGHLCSGKQRGTRGSLGSWGDWEASWAKLGYCYQMGPG